MSNRIKWFGSGAIVTWAITASIGWVFFQTARVPLIADQVGTIKQNCERYQGDVQDLKIRESGRQVKFEIMANEIKEIHNLLFPYRKQKDKK